MAIEKNIIFNRIQHLGTLVTVTRNATFSPEIPGGNYWLTKTVMTTGRAAPSCFSIDGYLYAVAGQQVNPITTTSAEQYNDSTNVWASRTVFNQAAFYSGISFQLSFGYAGYGAPGNTTDVSTISAFNESSNTWASKASGVTARRNISYFSLNLYGYVFRGISGATPTWSSVNERYDENTNTWTTKAVTAVAADGSAAFTLAGLGVASLGRTAAATYIATSILYNDVTNSWITNSTIVGTARFYATGMQLNDLGHSVGGATATVLANNDQFNNTSNSWSARSPNITALESMGGASLNGNGYCIGGDIGTGGTIGTGVTNVSQYKNYHLYKFAKAFRGSSKNPISISAFTTINDKNFKLPVQIRTDGTNWKLLSSGIKSATKTGEIASTVFAAGASGYRNYEVQVGIPYTIGQTTSGFWLTRASIPTALDGLSGFSIQGPGYIMGGENGGAATQAAGKYNDFANSWTSITSLSGTQSYGIAGVSLNGVGYAFSGSTDGGTTFVTTSQKYIVETNAWSSITAITTSREFAARVTLNSFAYVVAGYNGSFLSANEQYSDTTNAWVTKTSYPALTNSTGSFVLNGIMYAGYGFTAGAVTANAYAFNDAANTWATKTAGNTARRSVTSFSNSDRGFIIGGFDGTVSKNNVDEYKDTLNIWLVKSVYPLSRFDWGGFSTNNEGYAFGGRIDGTATSFSENNKFVTNVTDAYMTINLIVDEA